MTSKKRIVIVGATSSIAEHCARIWAQQKSDITLLGRNMGRLDRVAADLRIRSPQSQIRTILTDFLNPSEIQNVVDSIFNDGPVDTVLIAHGFLPEQNKCQSDLQQCRETLEINGISQVLFAEAFSKQMAVDNHGTIALIGSVAGDRGRKSNYVYGSAKAMVSAYAQGLQHRFSGTEVKVVLIKPGPTDTPMTSHLKAKGIKLASVNQVANKIVLAIEQAINIAYVPTRWKYMMIIIRNIPNFIFHKLNI